MNARTEHTAEELNALLAMPTLTTGQLAAALSVGATTLLAAIESGQIELPSIRAGTRRIWPTAPVRRLIGMEPFDIQPGNELGSDEVVLHGATDEQPI